MRSSSSHRAAIALLRWGALCGARFVPAFDPFNQAATDGSNFNPAGTTVAADFESVLDSFAYSYAGDGGGSETLPFSGLTAGGTYLLQVFSSDNRVYTWNTLLDIGGVTQTVYTKAGASTYANATIVLGPAETSFDLVVTGLTTGPGGPSSNGYDVALVNAVVLSSQVSEPQVPEPSTWATGLLAISLGFAGHLRNRKAD